LFVRGQHRALLISLVVALAVALGLGFLLARHFSRPLRQLAQTVDTLSDGNYAVRATVTTKDEIGRLGAGVNQLAESLASNRSMRRRWMADIAHELRTPVSVLKGEIEAIQDGLRPADEKTLASLGEEADHLSRLVNDLQTLALSDAGALDFRLEPVDLTELIRQQLQVFDSRLRARGIDVTSDLPGGLRVNGDAQRLRQLMQNLLENSSRYVSTGGALECKAARSDGRVTLLLDDSGPGLTAEQMTHLFDRFYRADSSRSRAHGGSGLGLSICRNIAEAHQGSIHAEVSPLGGLRIRLTLPAIDGTSG
jgi:two-component system sensor histidine kinase BaeS